MFPESIPRATDHSPCLAKSPSTIPQWLFELKLDGFRGIADGGRMLSKNRNRLARFDHLVADLPSGLVLDGEIIATDDDGRPQFADLMFGRRPAEYVVFDVLRSDGNDLRYLPLWRRKPVDPRPGGVTGLGRPRLLQLPRSTD